MFIQRLRLPALSLLAALSACSTLPVDSGRAELVSLISTRGHTLEQRADADAGKWVAEQLAQPLTAETAVQIALTQNPRLRIEYARLGLASAEVYSAGRLSNPRLSASIMFSNEAGAANQLSLGLAQSFTNVLLLPLRNRIAKAEFERVQQSAGAAILDLAMETESAFYTYSGARQIERMRAAVARTAGLSAQLAQRFFDAGNITRLELSRAQAAASQAQLDLLSAQAETATTQAGLNVLMGIHGGSAHWSVTASLPLPLEQEDELPQLLRLAGETRLDVQAARKEVSLLADGLGLTRRFRYLGEMEIGVTTERETDRSRITGPGFTWELPLFTQGQGAIRKAQAQLLDAEARLQQLEIAATNAVSLGSLDVANAKARAEGYRMALIPQRESIVAHTQAEVNYMLIGQFELLRAKQDEYDAYEGYLSAVRDYWIARARLSHAVGARLPSSAQIGGDVPDTSEHSLPDRHNEAHDMDSMEMESPEAASHQHGEHQ